MKELVFKYGDLIEIRGDEVVPTPEMEWLAEKYDIRCEIKRITILGEKTVYSVKFCIRESCTESLIDVDDGTASVERWNPRCRYPRYEVVPLDEFMNEVAVVVVKDRDFTMVVDPDFIATMERFFM